MAVLSGCWGAPPPGVAPAAAGRGQVLNLQTPVSHAVSTSGLRSVAGPAPALMAAPSLPGAPPGLPQVPLDLRGLRQEENHTREISGPRQDMWQMPSPLQVPRCRLPRDGESRSAAGPPGAPGSQAEAGGRDRAVRTRSPLHLQSGPQVSRLCPLVPQVEGEKLQEHEAQRLREHLALLLGALLEAGPPLLSQGEQGWGASTPGPAAAPSQAAELLQRCEALERKTATFENIVCVLNREVERVAVTAEACGRQHRLDQDRIEALSNKVQQLERSIGLKDLAMADLEQKVHEMEASTFDGVFIWKIPDFARKRQEAVSGRTPAIFSPAFYTSRYGYKMCLRAYLNGDGTGRGTHLSLFFVLMKGPHDALLHWPFNQKVTLMLLDQNNREHVIDAFRPDVTSSSFQRPVSDMNIASGCPLFCPVSKMEAKNSYVRDDAIFIKAIVDLTGL
ncbi:TNF receptor-associated factor 2 isoform X2 [Monodon monoceros]|uniref:TNF receptor-associated factor 2 isoform X2 n=1 Tax=Monodon monoceros TaxID=40151 RepID=UPI0010F64E6D|nr:TNF receptor-associated factor 2 isoform X2 [Monodon monoceros]